jgi:SAM-dependent methyltransferase
MMSARMLDHALKLPRVRRFARRSSDWVDLQYSGLINQLVDIAPRTRGRLLDVGCGEKPYVDIFQPFVREYVGVEHEGTFGATHSSSRSSKPDAFYDGQTLPFESQSFDTVICIQVLEHVPRPQRVLDEMARVVKKDGIVIVSTPFSFRLHEEPHDYFRYTPHGLRSMFESAGLVVEGIWSERDIWSVIGHKVNSFLAFRLARIESLAQSMGKHGHESTRTAPPRLWTLPFVLPAMASISAASRLLDRIAPDGTEALSYLVFGHAR